MRGDKTYGVREKRRGTREEKGEVVKRERERDLEVNRSNIVFPKHSTAIRTFPLSIRETSVYAFFAESVTTSIDDDTLETKVAG